MNSAVMIVDDAYADWEREIIEIERAHGEVTPELVLWKASQSSSALHAQFQWDDAQAANEYRILQAARLIRVVRVKLVDPQTEEEQPARRYVSVVKDEGDAARRTYQPLTEVVRSEELSRQMLRDALRDMATFRRKYATLRQLANVFAAIEAMEVTMD